MNSKKGVSLIVLGITGIVISILTGLVIVNVDESFYDGQGNKVHTNSITEAREVKFKNNITNAREEFEALMLTKKAKNIDFNPATVPTQNDKEEIKKKYGKVNDETTLKYYLRKPTEEVLTYIKIINGKFYVKTNIDSNKIKQDEIKWLEELKIKKEADIGK